MADILAGTPAGAEPPWLWPRAAYVHVPFCAHHCGYCDFAVVAGQDHRIDEYIDALAAELSTLGTPTPVRTLFLGGGTPTHLSPGQLERLLTAIDRWLPRTGLSCSLPHKGGGPSGPLPPCGGGWGWGVQEFGIGSPYPPPPPSP